MKRIGILHLTDLHCGGPAGTRPMGDRSDLTVSRELSDAVTYRSCMEGFFARAVDLLSDKPVDLIACTGDLGYQYVDGSLEAGTAYLSKLAQRLGVPANRVVVCPGNHDLDRREAPGDELTRFLSACDSHGFRHPRTTSAVCFTRHGLPVIGMNTCLGGTEHALHDLPDTLWAEIRSLLAELGTSAVDSAEVPEELKRRMIAMDIPAVGNAQLDQAMNYLAKRRGNTIVVLGHHSMMPTRNVDVRPYGQMLDSGTVMFRLLSKARRVIFMHGHSHCENALQAHAPDEERTGFIAAVGGAGLHGEEPTTATYIQLILTDNVNFLAANVFPFVRVGSDYRALKSYRILNPPLADLNAELDLGELEKGQTMPFPVLAASLGRTPDDSFAEDLLNMSSRCQIQLNSIGLLSTDEWQVTKL